MRYSKGINVIVVITEKVVPAATEILATKANTTTKLRITNLEIDGNTRRETPRSLSYMNPNILSDRYYVPKLWPLSISSDCLSADKLRKSIIQ